MGPPSSAAPQKVQPGIFRQGNSFSDSAQGAALGSEPRGLPSRRNDAAGENLAAQSTARGFTPGQRTEVEQPRLGFPGFRTPTIAHSGNDWQSRNDLRNAEVSASSITNTRRWGGRGAENSPDVERYRSMLGTDAALRQAQPGLEAETMRQNAGLMREDMQQAGGLQREAMQQAGKPDAQACAWASSSSACRARQKRAASRRAQRQEEQLRNTLLDPNATPQQKQQAQQSMRTIRVMQIRHPGRSRSRLRSRMPMVPQARAASSGTTRSRVRCSRWRAVERGPCQQRIVRRCWPSKQHVPVS